MRTGRYFIPYSKLYRIRTIGTIEELIMIGPHRFAIVGCD